MEQMPEVAQETFEFIIGHKVENDGNSPSLTDIKDGLNISKTAVRYRVGLLEKYGLICRDEKRKILVNGGKWVYEPATP